MTEQKIRMIDGSSRDLFDDISERMARVYKNEFAKPPWNEVSQCRNNDCAETFAALCPGGNCPQCESVLEEAYDAEGLVRAWEDALDNCGAVMEVEMIDGQFQRVTIARPTTQQELFEQKYKENSQMENWIDRTLPSRFVWIDDTFADRDRRSTGNLDGRGITLGKIAARYGGLVVATRTLQPAIVASTLRDAGARTDVYVGTNKVMVDGYAACTVGSIPDRRTLLAVEQQR